MVLYMGVENLYSLLSRGNSPIVVICLMDPSIEGCAVTEKKHNIIETVPSAKRVGLPVYAKETKGANCESDACLFSFV